MDEAVLEKYPVRDPEAPGEVLDGEAVVVTPADGQMHTLNATGTFVWERADGRHTAAQIAEALASAFEVDLETAQADVARFLSTLVEKGICRLQEEAAEADD